MRLCHIMSEFVQITRSELTMDSQGEEKLGQAERLKRVRLVILSCEFGYRLEVKDFCCVCVRMSMKTVAVFTRI